MVKVSKNIWNVFKTRDEALASKGALTLVYGKIVIRKRPDGYAVTINPKVKSWWVKQNNNLKDLFR